MVSVRPWLSRRDVLLLLLGFSMIHIWSTLSDHIDHERIWTHATTLSIRQQVATTSLLSKSCPISLDVPPSHAIVAGDLPRTSIIAHAPGWTLFRNLYMSNGTLYILSSNHSFPEFRLMTSTGLSAENTPENIASREPTRSNMYYVTPEEALTRWGGDVERGERNRVWSVEGNTVNNSLMSRQFVLT